MFKIGKHFKTSIKYPQSVALSSDGSQLAIGTSQKVSVIKLNENKAHEIFHNGTKTSALCFNGDTLAYLCEGQCLKIRQNEIVSDIDIRDIHVIRIYPYQQGFLISTKAYTFQIKDLKLQKKFIDQLLDVYQDTLLITDHRILKVTKRGFTRKICNKPKKARLIGNTAFIVFNKSSLYHITYKNKIMRKIPSQLNQQIITDQSLLYVIVDHVQFIKIYIYELSTLKGSIITSSSGKNIAIAQFKLAIPQEKYVYLWNRILKAPWSFEQK